MKKTIAVALVLGGLIPAGVGCSSSKAPVNRTVHFDLGKVLPGKSTKTTARLTNQEGFALRLVRAEVTCGCLTPEVEPAEIGPGGEAVATLTLVHPAKEGAFQQRASFVFAGGNDQEIVYTILIGGTILPWINATPAVVDFGRHMLGDRCMVRTQLQFSEPIAASEIEIDCSNPLLSARLLTGESDTEKTLEITYDTAKSTSNPEPEGYVRISRKKTSFSYNLPYKAAFDSLYKVEPDRLSLGIVAVRKPVTVLLHFSSSKLDLANGHWQVDGVPEGLNTKILSEKFEKKQDIAKQTITIQLLPIKPGIYRGRIALWHEKLQLRLELPCSLMAKEAK
jgi:hypothetical protein